MNGIDTWVALRSAMQDDGRSRRDISRDTLRRVRYFARPHRRIIYAFLGLATTGAVLGVATPLIAGQAANAIVEGRGTGTVVALAVAIAVITIVDSGVGLMERWKSSQLGEGPDPRSASRGVRARATDARDRSTGSTGVLADSC